MCVALKKKDNITKPALMGRVSESEFEGKDTIIFFSLHTISKKLTRHHLPIEA